MYYLHRLRLLRELKVRGTLAAVADALSYSPSTVSQQLSQLETEVGTPLLERVGRGVQLTPQARILVEHVPLCTDRLRLAGDGETSLRALAARPWIMEPQESRARQWALATCRDAGFEPDVRFESIDLLLHARMVEQHHAVAFLPDMVWAGSPPAFPLTNLPARRSIRRIFTACRAGARHHPAITALRAALADAAASAGATRAQAKPSPRRLSSQRVVLK